MTSRLIMISTPTHSGEVAIEYAINLAATVMDLSKQGIDTVIEQLTGCSLIGYARNFLTAKFMADQRCSHLLFIDADLGFAPEAAARLLRHNKGVVGGVYRIKERGPARYAWAPIPNETNRVVIEDGLARVSVLPAGFLMISRDVLTRYQLNYPEAKIKPPPGEDDHGGNLFDYFPHIVIDGILHGEDAGFCKRVREMGEDIWCDTYLGFNHYGRVGFEGVLIDMLNAQPLQTHSRERERNLRRLAQQRGAA